MSDKPEETKKEEIPAFRFSEKKIDDSWKEEARREREAAARAAQAGPQRAKPNAPGAEPAPANPAEQPAQSAEAPAPAQKPKAQSPAEQQQSKIFMTFLGGLAQQCLMQLGEMENPYTGQAEVDMQGARYTIELLNALQAKTQGNLSEEEAQGLTATIHDLRLRYVEIANELQRQVQAQMQKGGPGGVRPGPGGTVPGPGFGRR